MAALYRDPKTGAEWSGHARPPLWIKDVKDRSKFLIAKDGSPTLPTDKKAAAKGVKKAAGRPAGKKTAVKKGIRSAGTGKKTTTTQMSVKQSASGAVKSKKTIAKKGNSAGAPKPAKKVLPVKKTATKSTAKRALSKSAGKRAAAKKTPVNAETVATTSPTSLAARSDDVYAAQAATTKS
jgi:hypothetical protein